MAGKILRAAVVGASTLLGKELAEELKGASDAVWDITLLDAEDAGGTITAAGDEALVIQTISDLSFIGIDVVFFAGACETALGFWKAAHAAGASIVDLTGALEGHPQTLVRSPLVEGGARPDLATVAAVSAHPAAIMLGLAIAKLSSTGLSRVVATVLQPASELGSAGVEEVHQQTVDLLSFKPLKKDLYDAQVAFNLVASLGAAAKSNLEKNQEKIARHVGLLTNAGKADVVALQLLQAPVFHGYTASIFVQMSTSLDEEQVRRSLLEGVSDVLEEESPSNETVAGKREVLLRVRKAEGESGSAFWFWMAADNLRLAARNAAVCALELLQLKPISGVQ